MNYLFMTEYFDDDDEFEGIHYAEEQRRKIQQMVINIKNY